MDSGSEQKPPVIRVPNDPPTADPAPLPSHAIETQKERGARADVDVWLAVSILGSMLAAFGPLLPWWKISTLHMRVQVSTVTGTGVWPGVVAFAGGVVALCACTFAYAKPDRREMLGLVVVGAGAVAFSGTALAVSNRAHLVVTMLTVSSQAGIVVSLAGGLVAAVGGYLLTKDGFAREGSGR